MANKQITVFPLGIRNRLLCNVLKQRQRKCQHSQGNGKIPLFILQHLALNSLYCCVNGIGGRSVKLEQIKKISNEWNISVSQLNQVLVKKNWCFNIERVICIQHPCVARNLFFFEICTMRSGKHNVNESIIIVNDERLAGERNRFRYERTNHILAK